MPLPNNFLFLSYFCSHSSFSHRMQPNWWVNECLVSQNPWKDCKPNVERAFWFGSVRFLVWSVPSKAECVYKFTNSQFNCIVAICNWTINHSKHVRQLYVQTHILDVLFSIPRWLGVHLWCITMRWMRCIDNSIGFLFNNKTASVAYEVLLCAICVTSTASLPTASFSTVQRFV